MNRITLRRCNIGRLASAMTALLLLGATSAVAQSQSDEIARLTAAIAAQQKQIESLQRGLEQQQQLLQKIAAATPGNQGNGDSGLVASLAPVLPARTIARATLPAISLPQQALPSPKTNTGGPENPCEPPPHSNTAPPSFRLGNTGVMPVRFTDLTA